MTGIFLCLFRKQGYEMTDCQITDDRMGGLGIGSEVCAVGGRMDGDRINGIFRINEWGVIGVRYHR